MRIEQRDSRRSPLVIAEIGNNHEGSLRAARELVERAAEAGADAVKFQTFRTELFANPNDPARYERMRRFELTTDNYRELRALAKSLGLLFISTPLDLPSAEFLAPLVDAFKIASGDITFYPLLESVARSGRPVIMSTGASELEQARRGKELIEQTWRSLGHDDPQLAVLHCVSCYPVAPEDANLSAIPALGEALGCEVGYSDHTLGVEACVLSVALGATIIEKHFTLDKNYSDFRDHQLSADPPELAELTARVKHAAVLLGEREKRVLESEADILPMIRRSIVARRPLAPGREIHRDDLMWIRPSDGLPPGEEHRLLGRVLRRGVRTGEPIREADVA